MKLELIGMTVNELNMIRIGYDDTKIGDEYSDVEILSLDLKDDNKAHCELRFNAGAQLDDLMYFSTSIQAKIICHEIDNETFENDVVDNIDDMAIPLYTKATQLCTNLSTEVAPFPQLVLFRANLEDDETKE
ncbi:hypothetical protein HCJ39_05200 [Listeria rocourtiae]|uniref:hypothetical protein n=1 Tax=Listeria rocourtiae TaxID=647910 RepID=UPI001624C6E9|nr:hypothetical protein [Listeria rocourtiae]MBC1604110.1 hypothetical protein [Listeria rocourtiae]